MHCGCCWGLIHWRCLQVPWRPFVEDGFLPVLNTAEMLPPATTAHEFVTTVRLPLPPQSALDWLTDLDAAKCRAAWGSHVELHATDDAAEQKMTAGKKWLESHSSLLFLREKAGAWLNPPMSPYWSACCVSGADCPLLLPAALRSLLHMPSLSKWLMPHMI